VSNPRRANGHRRDQLRAKVLREEDACWLCGGEVDKTLKTPHPMSPEVHEVVPVSKGGDPLDRANCHLTHRRCNRDQGNRLPARTFETLRAW
jgi:5-methylcytosine-specific restriction endonuclease McrA